MRISQNLYRTKEIKTKGKNVKLYFYIIIIYINFTFIHHGSICLLLLIYAYLIKKKKRKLPGYVLDWICEIYKLVMKNWWEFFLKSALKKKNPQIFLKDSTRLFLTYSLPFCMRFTKCNNPFKERFSFTIL